MRRDPLGRRQRSALMARIRSRGNRSTELALLALLRRHHLAGWRRNFPLFGKPDFVFSGHRLAVFVDGEFWHGHPQLGRLPRSNRPYWRAKIARNRARDRLVNRILRKRGWRVLRIWEHQLSPKHQARILARLRAARKTAAGLPAGCAGPGPPRWTERAKAKQTARPEGRA